MFIFGVSLRETPGVITAAILGGPGCAGRNGLRAAFGLRSFAERNSLGLITAVISPSGAVL
jgi:hypothetical protein